MRIEARSTVAGAVCPDCGSWSRRIHSSYLRFPADVPSGGRRVALCLRVRRFICPVISCGRRTFVEQLSGLTRGYGRRTERLRSTLACSRPVGWLRRRRKSAGTPPVKPVPTSPRPDQPRHRAVPAPSWGGRGPGPALAPALLRGWHRPGPWAGTGSVPARRGPSCGCGPFPSWPGRPPVRPRLCAGLGPARVLGGLCRSGVRGQGPVCGSAGVLAVLATLVIAAAGPESSALLVSRGADDYVLRWSWVF
ncbi:transposase family protein [Streptomyces sp. NPDC089919]|uniref:transposase family protein n=1 Tax=Streptomyces sp. NPDC089919 TaxID=3155188 RepID=UPI003426317D